MKSLTIDIFENSEGEFQYDIYADSQDLELGNDPMDGGICTSTIENAMDMAYDMAMEILANNK